MSNINSPLIWTETERLAALRSYSILDTPREQAFDDIVKLTGLLLDAPIVAINLIDASRQWFKSEIGLGVRETPIQNSICKFALLEHERLIVPDTLNDVRFECNPLVTVIQGLRFYAGHLLKTSAGLPLGTLCVLDTTPRPLGLTQLQELTLKTLAQQVLTQLELRKIVADQDTLLVTQQRTQSELLHAQERSRLATDAAGLGIWSWNPATDIVTWENTRPYEIFGLTLGSEPLRSHQFMHDFIHPDDIAAFCATVAATLKDGRQFSFQARMRRADGAERWLDFLGKVRSTDAAQMPLVVGVVSDATERRLAELELLDSRARFENIVSNAATGVVQVDAGGQIVVVNIKFCEMLGYAKDELLGMNILEITADDFHAPTLLALARVRSGETGIVFQKQYIRADGALIWASSNVSPVISKSDTGPFEGVIAIVVDISRERAVEENLRQLAADLSESDRRKSVFLATLAHELRNPLAPIRTGLEVMALRGDLPPQLEKTRNMMERQVVHMVRLIDDLLDVARISRGKIDLQCAVVDLRSTLASAIETSMPMIERGRHSLLVHQPDAPVFIHADRARIVQALSNLLNNAAKYTPEGGRIEVTIETGDAAASVRIADNGIGILPESLASVFLLFSQIGGNRDRAQGGLGVGLSLVKQLIEMHGGQVEAVSAGAGTGSTFTIHLPLAQAGSQETLSSAASPMPVNHPLRVMVADDNVDAAESLAALLEIQGYEVRLAHDGKAALNLAKTFAPHAALLDIGMPEMNGYETAVALRSLPAQQNMVLIALTGWGNEGDRERAIQAGFDHHLTKPAEMGPLLRLLSVVTAP